MINLTLRRMFLALILMFSGAAYAAEVPDFSGVWVSDGLVLPSMTDGKNRCLFDCAELMSPEGNVEKEVFKATFNPPPTYKEGFKAKVADLDKRQVEEDTVLRCMPPGVPRIGPPDQIVQGKDTIAFLYDDPSGFLFRTVRINGKYREDYDATFLGDSIGWWEKDTLVVETVNLAEDTWLYDNGAFHTSALRVVERLKPEGEKLVYDVTAFDPDVLAEPWVKNTRVLEPSSELMYEPLTCIDDIDYQLDGSHHPNPR